MSLARDNPARLIAEHVASRRFADWGEDAVARTKTFLLDTLGVALAGSAGAGMAALRQVVAGWGSAGEDAGGGDGARVIVTGERLPAYSAAILNAYQIHCMEFDCVLEEAVVHPMATLLGGLLAQADRRRAAGRPVTGRELVTAINVGVDVAAMLGRAGTGPIRFFRPATCGGFGTFAGLASLEGLDAAARLDGLGAMYGQTSGTLQPHAEGSPLLGLQIGFNARGALCALDLAKAGIRGPNDVVSGQYGYLRLMEESFSEAPFQELGRVPQILRMSHKPYPSGRLTHGVIHALREAMETRDVAPSDIAKVTAHVPPLVHRLEGRPLIEAPEPNYAKLCLRHVAGAYLATGRVDLSTFSGEALGDPETRRYAERVDVILDDNEDPNALDPQRFEIALASGRTVEITLEHVYGHPAVPLTAEENETKFRNCAAGASVPLAPDAADRLVALVSALEELSDGAELMDALVAP